jgi:hypothetical protein
MMTEKDNKTKSFVLRIDSDTMAAIEKWASDEFRSTNGRYCLLLIRRLKKVGVNLKQKSNYLPQFTLTIFTVSLLNILMSSFFIIIKKIKE